MHRESDHLGIIQPKGFPGLPSDWISSWETFPASSGPEQIFAVHYRRKPEGGPRVLVIVHGLFEHGGRYLHFPHYLEKALDEVLCFDLRGHGRSGGTRGHVARFDELTEDVIVVLKRLHADLMSRFGTSEIHLFGHSLGGLIALRVLHKLAENDPELPIHSATLSAPLIGLRTKVPLLKRSAAFVLSKLWSSVHLLSELDPRNLSHDPEVREVYVSDRLVHQKVTPRFFAELQFAISSTLKMNSGFKTPIQILVPLKDQVVDSDVVMRYFRDLKSSDKELKTYPNFCHEGFNEIGKEKAFEDIREWIEKHSKRS